MPDRLHQSYSLARLAGAEVILLAAKRAGAAAAVLSDASPGVIAFAEKGHAAIQPAMEKAAKHKGREARGSVLRISNAGQTERISLAADPLLIKRSSFPFGDLFFTGWV
jgi:homoserine kinase